MDGDEGQHDEAVLSQEQSLFFFFFFLILMEVQPFKALYVGTLTLLYPDRCSILNSLQS